MPNTTPSDLDREALARIAAAIEDARYPGREGPYGLYDYSKYEGKHPPHRVRDFRKHLSHEQYGRDVFLSDSAEEAQAEFERLTQEHIAKAAVQAVLDALPCASGVSEAEAEAVAAFGLGKWMSAALDDPNVCSEMKADIEAWFKAGEPGHPVYASPPPVAAPSGEAEAVAPVAWRVKRGASNIWGYCENLDDAKSMWGVPVKIEPLYASPPIVSPSELSEAQQRLHLSEAVCYLEGTTKFAPGATLNKLIASGFHIAPSYAAPPPVAAPSGEADYLNSIARKLRTYVSIYTGDKEARKMADWCERMAPSPIASEPKDAGSGEGQEMTRQEQIAALHLADATKLRQEHFEHVIDRLHILGYRITRTTPSGAKP